jgi:predicted transposase/invertase (TIGR01784 family)
MESDSFFCQLFKRLPQTLFELLGLPAALAKDYEFDPVEIKKSYRMDGLFRPKRPDMPAYFLEVQFHFSARFYANLFAKAFGYLNDNPKLRDWHAVALFESRGVEPDPEPFEDLIASRRVTRIYLNEIPATESTPIGLGILRLVCEAKANMPNLVERLVRQAKREFSSREASQNVIELVEELLIRRFAELDREEIRKMFHLTDIRKTAVWREASDEGSELAKREVIRNCLARRMPVKEIAALVGMSVQTVRRIAKEISK